MIIKRVARADNDVTPDRSADRYVDVGRCIDRLRLHDSPRSNGVLSNLITSAATWYIGIRVRRDLRHRGANTSSIGMTHMVFRD
jgi:hypothetical protein